MLKVSETFRSLQGEGPGSGKPSFFLRLAGCNLHCAWCDTKYTWDWQSYRYDDEVTQRSVPALAQEIRASDLARLVVTGGEPLLQQRDLVALLDELGPSCFVEVETNGTILPSEELTRRIDQWNVSPKLASAGDPAAARFCLDALRAFANTGRAWLKLVVDTEADLDEARALVEALEWRPERVLLMPQATTRIELMARGRRVAEAAAMRRYGFTSRLHVELWDGRRGT